MKCTLISSALLLLVAAASYAADPKVEAYVFQTKMIYHSPESPGYTAWCGLHKTPDARLLVSFAQQTGKAPNVVGETVVLESGDVGRTWTRVKPGGYVGIVRQAAILPDGALVKATWPSGDDSSYVLRSKDGGATYGKRIDFVDPKIYKAWPGIIKPLRDGRLVLFAGVVKRGTPNADPANTLLDKCMFVSSDGGKSWGKPVLLVKGEDGDCEESDFCELPSGDLFWIHRAGHHPDHATKMHQYACPMGPNPPESYWYSDRMQSIAYKRGNTFVAGKATVAPIPHSGYPQLMYTKEGLILHLGSDGMNWSADTGKTWHRLDCPGTLYYPFAVQMDDGEIVVVSHRGGDDVYGTVDQAIFQQTFRLRVTR